jgi:PRTRC genetic system ThiF family protein
MFHNSYANALPIVIGSIRKIEFWIVGCGGTGSFLVPGISRLMTELGITGVECEAVLVDDDLVEAKNLVRQNFFAADVGSLKCEVLAFRYSRAFGTQLSFIPNNFCTKQIPRLGYGQLIIAIGCTDNAAARRELARVLDDRHASPSQNGTPSIWWLDCGNLGNGIPAGQVLLGSTHRFCLGESSIGCWTDLPSPSLQHPELLEDPSPEPMLKERSCADIERENAQALFINQRVAIEACEMLCQLLLSRNLRRFATYFDGLSGSARSFYTDTKTLSKYIDDTASVQQ